MFSGGPRVWAAADAAAADAAAPTQPARRALGRCRRSRARGCVGRGRLPRREARRGGPRRRGWLLRELGEHDVPEKIVLWGGWHKRAAGTAPWRGLQFRQEECMIGATQQFKWSPLDTYVVRKSDVLDFSANFQFCGNAFISRDDQ